jgi:hypothetical protein
MKTRAEFYEAVSIYSTQIRGYAAVRHADAKALLGDEWFAKLMADKIRRLGPTDNSVYPWNVTDYLQMKHQAEPAQQES